MMVKKKKYPKCNHCGSDNTDLMLKKGEFDIWWPQYIWCFDCQKKVKTPSDKQENK